MVEVKRAIAARNVRMIAHLVLVHGERHIRGLIHCSGDDMVLEVIPVDIRLQRKIKTVTRRQKVTFSIFVLEKRFVGTVLLMPRCNHAD